MSEQGIEAEEKSASNWRQDAFNNYSHLAQPKLREWLGGSYTSRDIHCWCQGYASALATPPVPAGEVEVTPAMLEAGAQAVEFDYRRGYVQDCDLIAIYTAMRRAALSSPSSDA